MKPIVVVLALVLLSAGCGAEHGGDTGNSAEGPSAAISSGAAPTTGDCVVINESKPSADEFKSRYLDEQIGVFSNMGVPMPPEGRPGSPIISDSMWNRDYGLGTTLSAVYERLPADGPRDFTRALCDGYPGNLVQGRDQRGQGPTACFAAACFGAAGYPWNSVWNAMQTVCMLPVDARASDSSPFSQAAFRHLCPS